MNPQLENLVMLKNSSQPKRSRPIHKIHGRNACKCAKKSPKMLREVGFMGEALKVKKRDGQREETNNYQWYARFEEWLRLQPSALREWTSQKSANFPVLGSIDQLFSLSSTTHLEPNPDLNNLSRYCRLTSFSEGSSEGCVLMGSEQAHAITNLPNGRSQSVLPSQLILLSSSQRQVLQKRAVFMEKLMESESKYDSSLGRMSQISKELAFTYRTYLQQRGQIFRAFQSLCSSRPSSSQSDTFLEEYTRLLIVKNLRHAFNDNQLDLFNYFKLKEFSEAGRSEYYQPLRNSQELRLFLQKRRPKRGRKLFLATACSVCLSDYCQASNPFESCGVCGIRTHQICFSLTSRKCGYCAYQKVDRHLKEQVSWCFICHQPGLMVIKFGEKEYAHGFCLLAHGYWRVAPRASSISSSLRPQNVDLEQTSGCFLEKSYRTTFYELEFTSPIQLSTSISLPILDSQLPEPFYAHLEDEDNSDSLGGIGVVQQSYGMWQLSQNLIKGGCQSCRQPFFKDCFLICQHCKKEFHCLCAYLNGFQLKISEGIKLISDLKFQLNCCQANAEKIGWNRKYKLNYNKLALSSSIFWPNKQEDPMLDEPDSPLLPH